MTHHTEFILQFKKILNWNDTNRYIRIRINWAADNNLLMQKLIEGNLQGKNLLLKLMLKIQMSYLKQKIKVYFYNLKELLIGELDLYIDQILSKKQKIQQYLIQKTDKKVLQIAKIQVADTIQSVSKVDLRQTDLKCSREASNHKRGLIDDYFIKERQRFLHKYRTSISKQKKQTLPEKISNLIQDVRNIKHQIRVSRTKSNQKLAESRERIKSIGKNSNTSQKKTSIKLTQNNKIHSNQKVAHMNPNLIQYGFEIQNDIGENKKQTMRQRIKSKNYR